MRDACVAKFGLQLGLALDSVSSTSRVSVGAYYISASAYLVLRWLLISARALCALKEPVLSYSEKRGRGMLALKMCHFRSEAVKVAFAVKVSFAC